MKKLLLVLLLFASAAQAQTVIQSCSVDGNGTNPANCTLTGVGSNHLLVLGIWHYGLGALSISDTFSLSWNVNNINTTIYRGGPSSDALDIAYAFTGSHTGSTTVGVSAPTSTSYVISEVSGIDTTVGSADTFTTANGTTSGAATISTGSFTTSYNGDFIFAVASAYTLSSGTGYTSGVALTTNYSGGTNHILTEYETAGSAGSYTATESVTVTQTWMLCAVAFKPGSSGANHRKAQVI
jgi:hypothetical protein